MRCNQCGYENLPVDNKPPNFCRQCSAVLRPQTLNQDEDEAKTKSMRFSFNTQRAKPVEPLDHLTPQVSPKPPLILPSCKVKVRGFGNYRKGLVRKTPFSTITLSYSATWIVGDTDTIKINSIKDEAFRSKVVRW